MGGGAAEGDPNLYDRDGQKIEKRVTRRTFVKIHQGEIQWGSEI